jgi:hypothetical protein
MRAGEPSGLPAHSVLADLRPFEWNSQESVRYEVALEILNRLAAACAARITREQAEASPDRVVLEKYDRMQSHYLEQQRALRSSDRDAVAEILASASALDRRITHDL